MNPIRHAGNRPVMTSGLACVIALGGCAAPLAAPPSTAEVRVDGAVAATTSTAGGRSSVASEPHAGEATPTPTALAPDGDRSIPSARLTPGAPVPGSAPAAPAVTTPSVGATAVPSSAAPTVIERPTEGAVVAGPDVDVEGRGTAFEGTLRWAVRSAGAVVAEGFTTAGANGVVGPFRFTVRLTPGDYVLEMWEPAMAEDGAASGGDGADPVRASRTFTVSPRCAA